MLAKRIIPCLDVKNGKLTKGVKFKDNIIVGNGDPIQAARSYSGQGADELIFYDISATPQGNKIMVGLVEKIAAVINIPFCVGGGIKNISDIKNILRAGADKISINSAAVYNPALISSGAKKFGRQCIVVGIDVSQEQIYINGGRQKTGLNAVEWSKKAACLGAGEICVNSIDEDGCGRGYDLPLIKKIKAAVSIPVIASGGAGRLDDMAKGAKIADAVLAASIFHYGKYSIAEVKDYLFKKNICVRI